MAKKPGPRAQMWCHIPVAHWMCSGYRFDLLDGRKVEGLCTCGCHHSGTTGIRGTSHAQNMVEDRARFEQARLISLDLHEKAGLSEGDEGKD